MDQSGLGNLKKQLNIIHKRNFLFVAVAILITSFFTIASFLMPEKYQAKSMVFIESNVIGALVDGIAVSPSMDDRLDVLSYSMKSRNLMLKVIDRLDLDISIEDERTREALITKLQKETVINIENNKKRSKGMNLFTVSLTHTDPVFARDYVNTLVNLYIEGNLSEKREESFEANKFLSEQIQFFKNKMDNIERGIVKFRTEKGIFVSVNESKIVEEIKDAEEKLEELRIMRMEFKAKRKVLDTDMKKESSYTAAFANKTGNTVSERIMALQKELNELLLWYTDNYPQVIAIRAELALLTTQLEKSPDNPRDSGGNGPEVLVMNPVYQDLKEELSRISSELAAMDVREQYLNTIIKNNKTYLGAIPAEKKKLAELEREKDSSMKIYEQLILRLGQSEVSNQMEIQDKGARFRIVDFAILPTVPVSPNRIKIILLGILAGLGSGFGLVLLIESMDRSVKSVDMLKHIGIPILGMIPEILIAEEAAKKRKRDMTIYSLGSFYMLCILGIFILELVKKYA